MATISGTLTSINTSAVGVIALDGELTYAITGTQAAAEVRLEKAYTGALAWAPVTPLLRVGATGSMPVKAGESYRMRTTAYTSGTVTYSFITPAAGVSRVTLGSGNPTITFGAGAPAATEPNGSIYMRSDGTTNTRLYVSQGAGTWSPITSA